MEDLLIDDLKVFFDFDWHTNIDEELDEDGKNRRLDKHIASLMSAIVVTMQHSTELDNIVGYGYNHVAITKFCMGEKAIYRVIDQAEDFKNNVIPHIVKMNNEKFDIKIEEFEVKYTYEQ